MKKALFLILLIASSAFADEPLLIAKMNPYVAGANVVAAAGGDSCTSGLLFSWHAETTTVTTGSPAGCSVGDTTAAVGSGSPSISSTYYNDGANSASFPSANAYYAFDWSSSTPIVTTQNGRIDFWLRPPATIYDGLPIVTLYVDASNFIQVGYSGSTNLYLKHIGAGTSREFSSGSSSLSLSNWNHIIAYWYATGNNNYHLKLCVDQSEGTTCTYGSWYDALGTVTGSSGTLRIGDYTNYAAVGNVDNLKSYDDGSFVAP